MMDKLPNPFWAVLLILMACALAFAALHSTASNAASVITMASSIVTGAFGYIQGVRDGAAKPTVPADMPPGSSATQTSTVVAGPKQ